MTEAPQTPKQQPTMPGFENARTIKVSDFFNPAEIDDIAEGHFGVVPLVELIKIALTSFVQNPSFLFVAPPKPIKIKDLEELFVGSDDDDLYIGDSQNNFATLKVCEGEDVAHYFLTNDEREKCLSNPVCVPDLAKLPRHKGNWKLASNNSQGVSFQSREVEGNHNSNYGSFHLDLTRPEVSIHLDEATNIQMPLLVEFASQQVASVLGEQDKTPVFEEIKIINPSRKYVFPLKGANDSVCDFRVSKEGKRGFRLSLAFNINGDTFVADIKANLVPNKVLDVLLK